MTTIDDVIVGTAKVTAVAATVLAKTDPVLVLVAKVVAAADEGAAAAV